MKSSSQTTKSGNKVKDVVGKKRPNIFTISTKDVIGKRSWRNPLGDKSKIVIE